jgi:multidrug efflux pump subunit AcrB
VGSDLQNQGRQAYVQIDRAQASRLGVTVPPWTRRSTTPSASG